jgi:hypothetical protein
MRLRELATGPRRDPHPARSDHNPLNRKDYYCTSCAASRVWTGRACLHSGDGDRVDDVVDQGAAGQVVHRLGETLQHGADAHDVGTALHRLVGRVAGVEVREHEYGRATGNRTVGRLAPGDRRDRGSVVLQRPVDRQRRLTSRTSRVASVTFSTSLPDPDVPVLKLIIATRGSMPNARAETALCTAMSASCCASGWG